MIWKLYDIACDGAGNNIISYQIENILYQIENIFSISIQQTVNVNGHIDICKLLKTQLRDMQMI